MGDRGVENSVEHKNTRMKGLALYQTAR